MVIPISNGSGCGEKGTSSVQVENTFQKWVYQVVKVFDT